MQMQKEYSSIVARQNQALRCQKSAGYFRGKRCKQNTDDAKKFFDAFLDGSWDIFAIDSYGGSLLIQI